jgi:O-succinylbenzoic acid--CoA ligase
MTPPEEYSISGASHALQDPAVISGGTTVTYARLIGAVEAAGERLQKLGVTAQARVAVVAANSVEYVIALLALWHIDAVACPLNTRLPGDALKDQLRQAGCSALLTSGKNLLDDSGIVIKKVNLDEVGRNYASGPKDGLRFSLGRHATVLFTSGGGAVPKAAAHTFGNHLYNARGANEHIPVKAGDRWLLSLPLYHVSGIGIIFRTILGGGTIVVPEDGESLSRAVSRYQITHLSLVSTQLVRLLRDVDSPAELSRLKAVLLGGGAVPASLVGQAVGRGWPVYTSYGLTETASQVATSGRLTEGGAWSRGHILKYVQVRVSDSGEILVRGRTLFQGYLNLTTISGAAAGAAVDGDGWFPTGDLGRVNEDGTLTVLGRRDNMFISGGENIQPEEIESRLCRVEGVLQAVVVPVKSEEFGARPVAFVLMEEGKPFSRSEILSSLRGHLPSFKLPDRIYAWPDDTPARGIKPDRPYFVRLAQEICLR